MATPKEAKFSEAENMLYDQSLKAYRDNYAALETARYEGKVEGKLENTKEIAINLINLGLAIELISKGTGLSIEDLEKLK